MLRGVAAAAAVVTALVLAAPAAADPVFVPTTKTAPPPGYLLNAGEAIAVAKQTPQYERTLRAHPGLRVYAYTNGQARWQVSGFAGRKELVQVLVDDRNGRVTEAWTGPQVAWKMARGYPGAFGRSVNSPWIWIPLCVLFVAPFFDPRRPFRLLHLDLLVLLSFGVSHFFFNRGEISTSVPLVYPVLAYLLVRMLFAGFRPRPARGPLIPLAPTWLLVAGVLLLTGFRIGLNVIDSNVIDVGYAGVIGADRIEHGRDIYGTFPRDNEHGDTYGPANYLLYVPFELAEPWDGSWAKLGSANGAAIGFDLITAAGLFLLGMRMRAGPAGRRLGAGLAWAWVTFPYALFVLETNANDALVSAALVLALLALSRPVLRGIAVGVGAAAKFVPLALAPLLAAGAGAHRGRREALLFGVTTAAVIAVLVFPFLPDGGVREMWQRTIGYQAGRMTPFSIWGQHESLGWLQDALKSAAIGLALLVAFVPRRRNIAQVAALGAAVLLALQISGGYWFYLYVAWFAPLVFVALFAPHMQEAGPRPALPLEAEADRAPPAEAAPALS
ncbi:MAG: glycosyltransferase 87 family protein [Thermoleophilaceae bacterium]